MQKKVKKGTPPESAHQPPTQSLSSNFLLRADEDLGYSMYQQAQTSKHVKVAADLFSISGDELVWFGGPAAIGSFLFALRGLGLLRPMGCLEESMWDCFGAAAVCIAVETFFKVRSAFTRYRRPVPIFRANGAPLTLNMSQWVFRRTRPTYAPQSKVHSVPGEWYSFPSGHSLRAFYWPFWLSRSKFVGLLAPVVTFPRARFIVPWACGVGWSRVRTRC